MSDFDDEPKSGSHQAVADDDWDDDWDDDRPSGSGRRDLTLVLAIAVAVLVIALVVVLTRPKDDNSDASGANPTAETTTSGPPPDLNWQGPVSDAIGRVDTRIAGDTGVFIWTDFEGWHIRNKRLSPVTVAVEAETVKETGATGDPKSSLTVNIPPGDGQTGVDVDLGFSPEATFTVSEGDAPIPAEEVKLGGTGEASENPVTFTKA